MMSMPRKPVVLRGNENESGRGLGKKRRHKKENGQRKRLAKRTGRRREIESERRQRSDDIQIPRSQDSRREPQKESEVEAHAVAEVVVAPQQRETTRRAEERIRLTAPQTERSGQM